MALQRKGKLAVTALIDVGSAAQKPRYADSFSAGSFKNLSDTHHCFIMACSCPSFMQPGLARTKRPIVQAKFCASVRFSFCEPSKATNFWLISATWGCKAYFYAVPVSA